MTTVLIVCRGINDINLLSRVDPQSDMRYVVASDDVQVHQGIKRFPWVETTSWLEKKETFYNVSEDVLKLLNVINTWLESLGNGKCRLPQDILYWMSHSEGGYYTQRLQDLLLLIRSYSYLIDIFKVKSIIILNRESLTWEDQVFLNLAKGMDITDVRIVGAHKKRFSPIIGNNIKLLAREFLQVFTIIWTKIRAFMSSSSQQSGEREIIFQLMGWADKHIESVLPLMKALKEKHYNAVALCWCGEKFIKKNGAYHVRMAGLPAVDLETYLPFLSFLSGPLRLLITWVAAIRNKSYFISNPQLCYRGIKLGHLLWPSVYHFFFNELLRRYRFRSAIKTYISISPPPLGIKIWGAMNFFESKIFLQHLKKKEKTMLIEVPISAVGFEWPYFPKAEYVDLYLVAGKSREKWLLDKGVSSDQIAVIGAYRYEHIDNFQKSYGPPDSRELLNIPLSYDHYFLYDSNKIIRGFISSSEQNEITSTILSVLQNHKNAALIIKPHPGHTPGMLESLVAEFGLENVYFVDRYMLPYHAINASDLLLTRISTIGVEAMLFKRPIVPVLFNQEKRFEIYNEASETIRSPQELKLFLNRYIDDDVFRKKWVKDTIERQDVFLSENLPIHLERPPSVLGAEAIAKRLDKKLCISQSSKMS